MCSHFACTCVCVCASLSQCVSWSTAGSVRTPALPARCVHVFVSECVWVRKKQTGLSYGLHAVNEESRLWDMPGCQEHPPPTLYRLPPFHSSVWMQVQSAVSPASSCHLETAPSASSSAWYEIRQLLHSYFLAWFTNVCCIFICMKENLTGWHEARLNLIGLKLGLD